MDLEIKINIKRLMGNLDELSKIGRNEGGGIDRPFGSEAEKEARGWLLDYWEKNLKLPTRVDEIANLWVDYNTQRTGSKIVMGSHHDTVPDGGKFDGALGVLLATEILETILENNLKLKHSISVISFTAEEPNPYNVSTLGSKVLSGRLKKEDLLKIQNRNNKEPLEKLIHQLGGDIHGVKETLMDNQNIAMFLECHIEQGKRLEQRNASLAAVSRITGIRREQYIVIGEANHAGTTVMKDRKDALLAAAQLILEIEKIAKEIGSDDVVATVGYMKLEPNESNIIPGRVCCMADIRTYQPDIEKVFEQKIKEMILRIEKERTVKIQREILLQQPHTDLSKEVIRAVQNAMLALGEEPISLISMAGHDAANMARITQSGMLFVRSEGGKSHCKEEYTKEEDIEKAGNAMLRAILILDGD